MKSDYKNKIKKLKIGIIDLKTNNLFSIIQACKNIGFETRVVKSPIQILKSDIIILPGVGSFANAMNYLKKSRINNSLLKFTKNKNKTLIGICLGMQLLFSKSFEFGQTKGLNIINGSVNKLKKNKVKVPHIGWSNISINKKFFFSLALTKKKYFFTHSFYCEPKEKNIITTYTYYEKIKFCSSIKKDNIIGLQFHPEKSGEAGLAMLRKLTELNK